jgi:multidrug resistance efflux pump
LFGILVTILVVGALTLYLNNSMSLIRSYRAELAADSMQVGVDYPGQVVKQYVQEGDAVKAGAPLFEIRSPQFIAAIDGGGINMNGLNFRVTQDTHDIVLVAGATGVVRSVKVQQGSYVSAGEVIAAIDVLSSTYVVSYYRLSPPDYARIKKGAEVEVTLPDNTRTTAKVFAINLERKGEDVDTVVKARLGSADLKDFRFAVGTPVVSVLHFNDKPWYQTLLELTRSLFEPVGR